MSLSVRVEAFCAQVDMCLAQVRLHDDGNNFFRVRIGLRMDDFFFFLSDSDFRLT